MGGDLVVRRARDDELDAVIDPAETRRWIVQGLDATANTAGRGSSGRGSGRFIDTW